MLDCTGPEAIHCYNPKHQRRVGKDERDEKGQRLESGVG